MQALPSPVLAKLIEHVGNEVRLMRDKVGVIDLSPFTKHEVTGPAAEAWLDSILADG